MVCGARSNCLAPEIDIGILAPSTLTLFLGGALFAAAAAAATILDFAGFVDTLRTVVEGAIWLGGEVEQGFSYSTSLIAGSGTLQY